MIILIIFFVILLLIFASIVPNRSSLSSYELRRRLDTKTPGALLEWRRGEVLGELFTVRRILIAFTLVIVSSLLIVRFGWVLGLVFALLVTLTYNVMSRFPPIHNLSQKLYNHVEARLLKNIDASRGFIRPFRGVADTQPEHEIGSRQELAHVISDKSAGLISSDEKKIMLSALNFTDKLVRDYMTPRSMMEAIGANELLGPLVLDDLHKTGHSHFPVFDGDIDHIVGMLHIHTLFNLGDKKSKTARSVMEPKVLYIHEEQPLNDALSACIKHRRHLLVVINEFRETVGVITIEDAVEQLIGRKIVDEFAEHDDLRKVAERNPRGNNLPKNHSDV